MGQAEGTAWAAIAFCAADITAGWLDALGRSAISSAAWAGVAVDGSGSWLERVSALTLDEVELLDAEFGAADSDGSAGESEEGGELHC